MRAGRLLSMLMLLDERGRLTAAQLSAELEVSVRTVLRDIESLSGAGVPVYAVRGPGGGFQLLGDGSRPLRSLRTWAGTEEPEGRRRVELRISDEGRRVAATFGWAPLAATRGVRDPDDQWEHVVVRSSRPDTLARQLLALGGEVEVVGPASLRIQVHRLALAAATLHTPGT